MLENKPRQTSWNKYNLILNPGRKVNSEYSRHKKNAIVTKVNFFFITIGLNSVWSGVQFFFVM